MIDTIVACLLIYSAAWIAAVAVAWAINTPTTNGLRDEWNLPLD